MAEPQDFVYAIRERIGQPGIFAGRQQELEMHLKWVHQIENEFSKSIAVLGRRKSGKTALMQRIYNIIWNENGRIIPFYIEMLDTPKWINEFCWEYYFVFISQYICFKTRNPGFGLGFGTTDPDTLLRQAEYYKLEIIAGDIKNFKIQASLHQPGNLFRYVVSAPERIAKSGGDFFVVMIDEFQYMNEYIFWDEARTNKAKGLVGYYHDLSESKISPMFVSGSYVGWLKELIADYFEGGRLRERELSPTLKPEEGLECIRKYSEISGQPVTPESALVLNELTKSSPFYISSVFDCVMDNKDLRTARGVMEAFSYEISDRGSELHKVWMEYIRRTISSVNDRHVRNIVLFLLKHSDREWSRDELREHLNLQMPGEELEKKLAMLVKGDLIGRGTTMFRYRSIPDKIFELIFRGVSQDEIDNFQNTVKHELIEEMVRIHPAYKSLQGRISYLQGHFPEYLVSLELRKQQKGQPLMKRVENYQPGAAFADYKAVYTEYKLNLVYGREHEADVYAYQPEGQSLVFELKNQQKKKANEKDVRKFMQLLELMKESLNGNKASLHGIFLSQNGFTAAAIKLMEASGIMYAGFRKWFEGAQWNDPATDT